MLEISRKIELNKLLVLKDKNFIKVVTGVLLYSLFDRPKNLQVQLTPIGC